MRRLFDWLLLLSVGIGGGYMVYTHPQESRWVVRDVQNMVVPCSSTITYSIGTIDPRFNFSQEKLVASLEDAEIIWETPSGKNLFEYMPCGGNVTVNLVYDDRQASTDKLQTLGIQTGQDKASYEVLRARYDTLSSRVKAEQSNYDAAVSAYKQHQDAYNAEVQSWNKRGGAPSGIFADLQREKAELASEFAQLKSKEAVVNADVATINALATALNQLIVQLNLSVAQYNSVGAAAGEFEEGEYRLVRGIETIDIYEYSDRTRLVRVLAHEMGHALGLEHVEDPEAIMYKVNSGKRLSVNATDIAELDRVCRSKAP